MGEELALGLGVGLGEAVPSDGDGLAGVGDGLAWWWCAGVGCTWVAVGDGVAAGESAPPDPVVVDGGATST